MKDLTCITDEAQTIVRAKLILVLWFQSLLRCITRGVKMLNFFKTKNNAMIIIVFYFTYCERKNSISVKVNYFSRHKKNTLAEVYMLINYVIHFTFLYVLITNFLICCYVKKSVIKRFITGSMTAYVLEPLVSSYVLFFF